jgi:O-antigen/teichoic acid export membrane protein
MLAPLRKSTLAKNAGWTMLGQVLGYGMRVIYFIVIARLLGVMEYGIVVGALALVMFVAQYSRMGMGTVLMRYVSGSHSNFAAYWGNVIMASFMMSGILILLLRFTAYRILDYSTAAVVVMTAIGSVFCEQLITSATQAFQAFESMKSAAILGQLISFFRTCTAVGMLLILHHTTARVWVVASMIASVTAAIVALTMVTIQLGWPKFEPRLAIKHAGEGLEYSFAASTVSAYNDLDKTMLSHYGMAAENGVYGLAYRVIDIATTPLVAIQLASEPRLFQLAERSRDAPVKLGRRLLAHSVLVSVAAALLIVICAPMLPIITGQGFAEVVSALRWLCLIPVFRSVHQISGSVITSLGLQRYRTIAQVIAVAINVGLNVWLIPTYGWHGAAWSSLTTDGSLGLLNWCVLQRYAKRRAAGLAHQAA